MIRLPYLTLHIISHHTISYQHSYENNNAKGRKGCVCNTDDIKWKWGGSDIICYYFALTD